MIWFTADHHFGHENIIKFSGRPFISVDNMDEFMIARWNSAIEPGDTVYHLGDFAYKKSPSRYVKRLNGKIYLILGNHDKPSQCHGLFEDVFDVYWLLHEGKGIWLSHYPHESWKGSSSGSVHLHGHTHIRGSDKLRQLSRRLNVNVELHGYFPVPIYDVMKLFERKESVNV